MTTANDAQSNPRGESMEIELGLWFKPLAWQLVGEVPVSGQRAQIVSYPYSTLETYIATREAKTREEGYKHGNKILRRTFQEAIKLADAQAAKRELDALLGAGDNLDGEWYRETIAARLTWPDLAALQSQEDELTQDQPSAADEDGPRSYPHD